jgi:hypothetical protein
LLTPSPSPSCLPSFSYSWYELLLFCSKSSLSALKLPEDPAEFLYLSRCCCRSFCRWPMFVSCEEPPLLKDECLDLEEPTTLEDLWSSKVITSSSSMTYNFLWPF